MGDTGQRAGQRTGGGTPRKAGSKGPCGAPEEVQGKFAPGRAPRSSLCPGSRVPSKTVCTCPKAHPSSPAPS